MSKPQCEGTVYHSGSGWSGKYVRCGNHSSVDRDGKHYCKRHDPVSIAEKALIRNEKYRQQIASDAKRLRMERAAPDLYEALAEMVEIAELTLGIGIFPMPPGADGPLPKARAALAKARGES